MIYRIRRRVERDPALRAARAGPLDDDALDNLRSVPVLRAAVGRLDEQDVGLAA